MFDHGRHIIGIYGTNRQHTVLYCMVNGVSVDIEMEEEYIIDVYWPCERDKSAQYVKVPVNIILPIRKLYTVLCNWILSWFLLPRTKKRS